MGRFLFENISLSHALALENRLVALTLQINTKNKYRTFIDITISCLLDCCYIFSNYLFDGFDECSQSNISKKTYINIYSHVVKNY